MNPKVMAELAKNTGALYVTGTAGGSTSLSPDQQVVLVTPPSSGTHTVTLPNCNTAKGRFFAVYSDGNDTGTVTVDDSNESGIPLTAVVLTADDDYVILYCSGYAYHSVSEVST